jgi:hypothetical protein
VAAEARNVINSRHNPGFGGREYRNKYRTPPTVHDLAAPTVRTIGRAPTVAAPATTPAAFAAAVAASGTTRRTTQHHQKDHPTSP